MTACCLGDAVGVLHLVFQSPAQTDDFHQCFERTGEKDAVLLLAGAVIGAKKTGTAARVLKTSPAKIYVLKEDLVARGISADEVVDGATLITFDEFVALTVTYSRILSW